MSASKLPPFCADCRKRHPVMLVLRAPTGAWQLCAPCWIKSAREAAEAQAAAERRLAAREKRQPHRRARVGSHQDETPVFQDEIFTWGEAAE